LSCGIPRLLGVFCMTLIMKRETSIILYFIFLLVCFAFFVCIFQLTDSKELWKEMGRMKISFTSFQIKDVALFYEDEQGFRKALSCRFVCVVVYHVVVYVYVRGGYVCICTDRGIISSGF